MKKYYIFSEMFGNYSYQICIIEAKTLKESFKKLVKSLGLENKDNLKVRDYNYNPKLDPNRRITIDFNDKDLFTKEEHKIINDWNDTKIQWLINNYDRVLNHSHYAMKEGISKIKYLETNEEGWFDWIEVYGDLPENYIFSDGHDG
jgi:hypothetical protein